MNKKNNNVALILVLALFMGLLGGTISQVIYTPSQDSLIREFYAAETAVMISPHHLRKGMDEGDETFILVDLRSEEEYVREHIIGAVNIPAYKNPEESAYDDKERIVRDFKTLIEENPDREIIAYCYSMPCMTGRKIGHMLAEEGVYIKELGVGWNEWRYFWTMWNHEHEWNQTNVTDYTHSGIDPGVPISKEKSNVCVIDNEFGC
jgi:rhodanese-related sulfurtransferase